MGQQAVRIRDHSNIAYAQISHVSKVKSSLLFLVYKEEESLSSNAAKMTAITDV